MVFTEYTHTSIDVQITHIYRYKHTFMQFSSIQFSRSIVSDTLWPPWIAAGQASLSITFSRSSLKLTSIRSVMPSSHLILWHPLILLLLIFPSIWDFSMSRVFASDDQNTGASASASVLPVNIQGWSPLRLTGLISLLSKGLSGVFSSTTVWRHQFFGILPPLWYSSYNHSWPLGRPQP